MVTKAKLMVVVLVVVVVGVVQITLVQMFVRHLAMQELIYGMQIPKAYTLQYKVKIQLEKHFLEDIK